MKIIVKGQKEPQNVYIETILEGTYKNVLESDLREPTQHEVDVFKRNPCNHKEGIEQLVYDIDCWCYQLRYCAICGISLGTV